jgi:polyketide synthase PksN
MNNTLETIALAGLKSIAYQITAAAKSNIIIEHHPLFDEICTNLKDLNIEKNHSAICFPSKELEKKFPEYHYHIIFLEKILNSYMDILSGKLSILSVLVECGGLDFLSSLYESNPEFELFNLKIRDFLKNEANNDMKILEVGAGTGSTTKAILDIIGSKCKKYDYTDISNAFLAYGKTKFSSLKNNMNFFILDINNIKETSSEQYDIIISTDVLHNAQHIINPMQFIHSSLKENGKLIVNETTTKNLYSTLVFGLFPGWWCYQDKRIKGSPLLSRKMWINLFHDYKFSHIETYPTIEFQNTFNQTLFIAHK